ncbi:MutS like protein [Reticulomyxa filosa]|uniref:MutS like protein n=1 Tax=Reticulomyxa filosa TaxID=46433 RepID=X6NAG2_RETFI|nr:MutS like protein [Reticulomyxa filosa]|eukprot:ETO22759.1 MutS like protein [Reticulomyxa filosa]
MSLFGLLNKCQTPMGSRLLSSWIRQPLVDIEKIKRRQKLVTLFFQNTDVRSKLRDDLMRGLPDLEKVSNKLRRGKASLKECVSLYNFCQRLPWIKEALSEVQDMLWEDTKVKDDSDIAMKETKEDESQNKSEKDVQNEYNLDEMDVSGLSPFQILERQFIKPLSVISHNFHNFSAMVEKVVDLEKVTTQREYLISATYDEVLSELDKKLRKVDKEMESIRQNFSALFNTKNNKDIVTLTYKNTYGWHLRVPMSTKGLKDLPSTYTKLASAKNGVLYGTSALDDLSKQKQRVMSKYNQRQDAIIKKVLEVTTSYLPVISNSVQALSHLDVLLSFAHVASCAPQTYVCPKILAMGSGEMIAVKARHPCLEMQDQLFSASGSISMDENKNDLNSDFDDNVLTSREMGKCVSNDVSLIAQKSNFQIVTGPNMGGKSTYIRMIGLLALMAQIGSFVPCEKAIITVVDSILARVGAGDHQLKGLSTFMAEMLETGTILEAATSNSLVIIDELGRGTSTYDGFGIAYAISEHIAKDLGCFCLFATHFHELTALANTLNGVVNKHVTAYKDDEKNQLTMLYKIQDGPCDHSFGIQVAQLAKFPKQVIERAEQKAQDLESVTKRPKITLQTFAQVRLLMTEFDEHKKKSKTETEHNEALQIFKQKLSNMCEKNQDLDSLVKNILSGGTVEMIP